MRIKIIYLFFLLVIPVSVVAQRSASYTIDMTVKDKETKEAIIMATIQLQPSGAAAVTDMEGQAIIRNVEPGTYTINISYVGYEPVTTQVKITKDMRLVFQLVPTTLVLSEVTVTAKQNAAGAATSSIIGRQAIDHLQASSLADLMQIIPGNLMTNTDLTAQSNLQIRTLQNNNTAAFGSSVILDGVPGVEQWYCKCWRFLGYSIYWYRPTQLFR